MKKVPPEVIKLRRKRRDEEVSVNTLLRRLKVSWNKSTEKGSTSTDVTRKRV